MKILISDKKFIIKSFFIIFIICSLLTINTNADVLNNNPLWIDIGGPYYGLVDEPILFYLDIQGGMAPYYHNWNFGDGNTSTLRFPEHSYDKTGTYSVSVTVTDFEGTSLTKYANAIIYDELVVDSGGPYSGFEGNYIQLLAIATGGIPPYSYNWDLNSDWKFDDGNSDSISYKWNESGTYSIAVQVTDELGNNNIDISEVIINIMNTKPDKPNKPTGEINGEIGIEYSYTSFTTDPENNQVYYLWDWGDGNESGWIGPYNSGQICEIGHIWSEKGDYEVKLRAKDAAGLLSEWSDPLTISMPRNQRLFRFMYDIIDILIQRYPFFEKIFLLHSFYS